MTTESVNSLARASSSYLRSAMHQPIRWHEWSEEAFQAAQRENKPILLDIGAVWCHWCHVMDRESYDDPEIANLVNQRFIAIKVDRDERPDIDSRYQMAVQAISGQGGWPLTAFLTPEGRPFYGGTYFPPLDHYGRPSFRRVLVSVSDAYREKQGEVVEQSKLVEGAIAHSEALVAQGGEFSSSVISEIIESALKMFDERYGGFGSAPKFPHPSMLELLIERYVRSREERLRTVFATTLEHMARGGVYDQLGGGFHRYSVDERWLVPHFEKMSYDNSELLKNYAHAYLATGSELFHDTAVDILRWVDEWLSDRAQGGFYASQDADYSMDDDGDYFTWTLEETRSVLSEEEARVAGLHYDINEIGEMHHNPAKNVLYQRASLEEIAARLEIPQERAAEILASAKQKMYAARLERPTPYVDKTIYVSWNALFISAYLAAARALALEPPRRFALRSLDRILAQAWNPSNGLRHVVQYSEPAGRERQGAGFLDDYAATALALLDAYETTCDITYFRAARTMVEQLIERFYDFSGGGFFDRALREDALGVLATARKPFQDSPTPAGNALAALALIRMHGYSGERSYQEKAERTLGLLSGAAGQYGLFAASYAIAAAHLSAPHTQVVILGEDENARELYQQAVSFFQFGHSVIRLTFEQAVEANLPPILGQTIPQLPAIREGKSAAIVCSEFVCKPPAYRVDELNELLPIRSRAA